MLLLYIKQVLVISILILMHAVFNLNKLSPRSSSSHFPGLSLLRWICNCCECCGYASGEPIILHTVETCLLAEQANRLQTAIEEAREGHQFFLEPYSG